LEFDFDVLAFLISSFRIKCELMPIAEHFWRRQNAQVCRVSIFISQVWFIAQGRTVYLQNNIKSNDLLTSSTQTSGRKPFRRKNVLHGWQESAP